MPFSMHLPYMHLSYIVACTSFYWERFGNNAQLKWLDPLLIEDDLYLWTNFESQDALYFRTEGVDGCCLTVLHALDSGYKL
jgi:hypothetical protein